jgi:hypothetical protein
MSLEGEGVHATPTVPSSEAILPNASQSGNEKIGTSAVTG